MNSDQFPELRGRLVLALDALPGGAASRGLIQFCGETRQRVADSLDALRADGAAGYDARADRWVKLESSLWDEMARRARESAGAGAPWTKAALVEGLACLYDKRWLEGAEKFLLVIRQFFTKGSSAAALLCLDLLAHALDKIDAPGNGKDGDDRFVKAYKEFIGAALFMGKRLDEVTALSAKALRASMLREDARSALLLNLYGGIVQQLHASHNADIAFSLLRKAVRDIKDFEDAELYESIGPALGVYYQAEGDFHEASKYLGKRTQSQFLGGLDYFAELCTRYHAAGLMIIGRYAQATGMLEGALREANLLRLPLQAKWRQAQLASSLMWLGRQDTALELLDAVICGADPKSETKLWIFCTRILALYFFHKGDVEKAHHILFSAMSELAGQNESRPFYAFSWILELLWAFERQGLPRIPGHDFDKEFSLALGSPNKLFRGAALRIQAERRTAAGERPEAVIKTLSESLFYLESGNDLVGIARTRLALARNLEKTGAREEADRLFRQACATLFAFGQHDCPREYMPERKGPARHVPDGQAGLAALTRLFDKELTFADESCFAQRMVQMICQELDLERAALFEAHGETLECAGACNISPAELESPLFAGSGAWLASRIGASACDFLVEQDGAALCLPVYAGEKCYLLFSECRHFPEHLSSQPRSLFTGLSRLLAEKLKLLHSVRRYVNEALQSVKSREKEANERLSKAKGVVVTPSMRTLLQAFDQAARADASILITGETGVGKEGLARRAHEQSGRIGPFVPVHPGGTPENLFESEFFGHEKGAFTGAHQKKTGLFEIADKGTLFIDEVGDMPMPIQVKLLRVLQEKSFLRVGGVREVCSDFRLVAATNRNLETMVAEGSFRRDLFYRISVIPFSIPPLRRRPDDILFLAGRFIEFFCERYGKAPVHLSEMQRMQLLSYAWPGNIRELKSVLERAVILSSGGSLQLHLAGGQANGTKAAMREARAVDAVWEGLPTLEEMELRYISYVLKLKKGKVNGADGALAVLGMKRSTLYQKIRKYKLDAISQLYGADDGTKLNVD